MKIKNLRFLDRILAIYNKRSERFKRAFLSGIANGSSKFITIIINFITVPLTIHYLGTERYGMWMTITGTVGMLTFADLGIGNGLLNSIAYSYGKNDINNAKKNISTAFVILLLIATIVSIAAISSYFIIPWYKVFNVKSLKGMSEAAPSMLVILLALSINFPLGVVQKTYLGFQEEYIYNLWQILGTILSFIFLLISIYIFKANLVILLIMFSSGNIIASILGGFFLFLIHKKEIKPELKYFEKNIAYGLLKTGGMFLIIQIASILAYSADNIIIAQYLGLTYVAVYAVVVKLFNIGPQLQSFFIAPLWPAYGEAHAKNDWLWIKNSVISSTKYSVLICFLISLPFVIWGKEILHTWTRGEVNSSFMLLFWSGMWATLRGFGGGIAAFLNGINKLKPQIIYVILFGISSIILKIFLVKGLGLEGLVLITILTWTIFSGLPSYFLSRNIFLANQSKSI